MNKKRTEKILTRRIKAIRKIWLKYVDSLPEKGNEEVKRSGYLTIAIFRTSLWFNSCVDRTKIKKEDSVDVTLFFNKEK